MAGDLTDEQKHAYARERGYPSAVFLPRSLYKAAEAEGHDMRMFVITKLMPNDKPRWPCPGDRKRIRTCSGRTCMPGLNGSCVACADDE